MSGERIGLMAILVLAAVGPIPVLAQTGVVVQGSIVEAGGASRIQNARVELDGYGATLTTTEGTFRFERVQQGAYTLRIDAFGYASATRSLSVSGDVTVTVALEIAPLPLDPLIIEPREIDIRGRVRDPGRDLLLGDVDVLTNQVEGTETDVNGRFRLKDVLADVPLHVGVRAFGYLPLDTMLLPDEDERYVFELEPDPLVERMIEVQVGRIEERSAGRTVMRSMNRERLLRWAGHATLRNVLEGEYRYYLRRVICIIIDERQMLYRGSLGILLDTTVPEEVERIEFMYSGQMLRIYTRAFIRDMMARDIQLRAPTLVAAARPPMCL